MALLADGIVSYYAGAAPDSPKPEAAIRNRTAMTRVFAATLGCAAIVALIVAARAGATTGAATRRGWTLVSAFKFAVPTSRNRAQFDTVLVEDGQPWMFGGSNVTGRGVPQAVHRTNGRLTPTIMPGGLHSWIVAASGPAADYIWAVTYLGGSVLSWNGSVWSVVPDGGWAAGTRFTGIVVAGAGDVWVFGSTGGGYVGAGTWHWDGAAWTRSLGAASDIYQASPASATDFWGIGGGTGRHTALTNLLHFRAGSWHRAHPPALTGFRYSYVLALTPRNVWVAGTVAGRPKLGHFNGHSWRALRMPGTVPATGLCRDGHGGLWAIANTGARPSVVRHRSSAGIWSSSTVSASAANEVLACVLDPGTGSPWGAGRAAAPRGSAAAAYRYGRP